MTPESESSLDPLLAQSGWAQRLARALVAEGREGEDAVQDAWVAVLEGRAGRVAAPRRWLSAVARNFARISQRKEGARRAGERRAARPERNDDEPARIVARAELMQEVVAAVLVLPEPYRSTLLMRYLDELSAEEIARRQGVSGSTVRNRLRRGLALVRRRFGGDGGLPAWLPVLPFPEVLAMTKTAKVTIASVFVLSLGAWLWTSLDGTRGETEVKAARRPAAALAPVELPEAEGISSMPEAEVAEREEVRDPTETSEPLPEAPAAAPVETAVFVRPLTVVDHEGEPVPDVEITLETEQNEVVERLLTDELGSCELRHVEGTLEANAFKRGIGIARTDVGFSRLRDREPVELRIVKPIHVDGVVLQADGSPAPGATVEARMKGIIISEDLPFAPDPVVTDAEGRFDFQLHSNGSFYLQATFGEERSAEQEVALHQGYEHQVEIRLLGGLAIAGQILLPNREPASGSMVRVREIRELDPEEPTIYVPEWPKVAEDGRFRYLAARPGEYQVTARSPEASPLSMTLTIDDVRPRHDIELVLEPAITITGVVEWEDGRPAAGCQVLAWPDGETDPARLGLEPDYAFRYGYVVTETAEDGSFSAAPLDADRTYSLAFRPDPEREKSEIREYGIPAGSEGVEIVLSDESLRGAFVTGSISSSLGLPLEDVRVQVHWREKKSDEPWFTDVELSWKTDIRRSSLAGTELWQDLPLEAGRYQVEHLVPGRQYVLFVKAKGHGRELVGPWTSDLSGTERDILLRETRTVEIQVLSPDGLPASHAEVHLGYQGTVQDTRWFGERYTDEDGLLLYDELIPGPYFASVNHKGAFARNDRFEVRAADLVTRITLALEEP